MNNFLKYFKKMCSKDFIYSYILPNKFFNLLKQFSMHKWWWNSIPINISQDIFLRIVVIQIQYCGLLYFSPLYKYSQNTQFFFLSSVLLLGFLLHWYFTPIFLPFNHPSLYVVCLWFSNFLIWPFNLPNFNVLTF